jgi:hypothetical protein
VNIVEVSARRVFTPMGFGENNIAQIGIAGEFPNGCYRLKDITWKHDGDNVNIRVWAYRYVGPCPQRITPWFILKDPMVRLTSAAVIEVLPEVETAQNDDCQDGRFPFHKRIAMPRGLPAGEYMIYIRIAGNTGIAKRERILDIKR